MDKIAMHFGRFRRLLKPTQTFRRNMSSCGDDFKVQTVNDLPSPKGDWATLDGAKQRKNNIVLVMGAVVLTVTLAVGNSLHVWDMNLFPPENPSERPSK